MKAHKVVLVADILRNPLVIRMEKRDNQSVLDDRSLLEQAT